MIKGVCAIWGVGGTEQNAFNRFGVPAVDGSFESRHKPSLHVQLLKVESLVSSSTIIRNMILEVTKLEVRPSHESSFERALVDALRVISSAEGYVGHSVQRSVDQPNCYLLCVRWREKKHSTIRFRESGRLKKVREILHRYYEVFPETQYYDHIELAH